MIKSSHHYFRSTPELAEPVWNEDSVLRLTSPPNFATNQIRPDSELLEYDAILLEGYPPPLRLGKSLHFVYY